MDDKSLLTVNVVTPDGVVYDNTTDLAVCKTTLGEVGIMPIRVPLLASLAIDEVRVKTGEDSFDEIAVSGGMRGVQLIVNPDQLLGFVKGEYVDLTA